MSNDEKNAGGTGVPQTEKDECAGLRRPCWHAILLGFAAGSGGALIGVGGGIIMIPILTMWGHTQKRAQGTSLIVILAMTPVAIFTYAVEGNIDFHFAIPLAIGGTLGSMLGSMAALRFSNRLLAKLFGGFLILIALKMIFTQNPVEQFGATELNSVIDYIESGLMGMFAGFMGGFFGVGGGIIFVPTGVLLAGLSQVVAQGSSLTAMLPTSAAASYNYYRNKEIDWNFAGWLIPGAWLGAVGGSVGADTLAGIRDGSVLTIVFALFLLYTGVRRLITIDKGPNKV